MAKLQHQDEFDAPVFVTSGISGQAVAVRSSLQALERLLSRWPTREGVMYQHARNACALAIKGSLHSSVARKAFARAAKEAGILVDKHGWEDGT